MTISKLGAALTGIYVIFTVSILLYAFLCGGMYCSLIGVLPALPWLPLSEEVLNLNLPLAAFPVTLLLNAGLLYLLGFGLEKLIGKLASRMSFNTRGG